MDPDPGKEIEVDPDPDPRKEIEVDPDPERGLKWIQIRIRPNAVDPGGSGSGSETLIQLLIQTFLNRNKLEIAIKLFKQNQPFVIALK